MKSNTILEQKAMSSEMTEKKELKTLMERRIQATIDRRKSDLNFWEKVIAITFIGKIKGVLESLFQNALFNPNLHRNTFSHDGYFETKGVSNSHYLSNGKEGLILPTWLKSKIRQTLIDWAESLNVFICKFNLSNKSTTGNGMIVFHIEIEVNKPFNSDFKVETDEFIEFVVELNLI